MSREDEIIIGDVENFHITVRQCWTDKETYELTIWHRNQGVSGLPSIRDCAKAEAMAAYLYENLLPEYVAGRERQEESFRQFEAELAKRPKPKPVKVPKNAPILPAFLCSQCGELTLEKNDEPVYECGQCGTTGTGEDGRRCDQCHKFTAKISETSCPQCEAAMDDAEDVHVRQATDGTLVRYEQAATQTVST